MKLENIAEILVFSRVACSSAGEITSREAVSVSLRIGMFQLLALIRIRLNIEYVLFLKFLSRWFPFSRWYGRFPGNCKDPDGRGTGKNDTIFGKLYHKVKYSFSGLFLPSERPG